MTQETGIYLIIFLLLFKSLINFFFSSVYKSYFRNKKYIKIVINVFLYSLVEHIH